MYKTLRARLDAAGIRPSTRRGQNFLLDPNQLQFIAGAGELSPRDVVLEVGPGSGFLTRRLARSGAIVLGVELDHGLLPVAKEETEGLPNVFYIEGDILSGKNRLNPEVTEKLDELLRIKAKALAEARNGSDGANGSGDSGGSGNAEGSGGTGMDAAQPVLKSVSNLPYSAGTPFIMNALASPLPWAVGIFLLQLEVAERIVAPPGGKNYGSLSISAGLAATTTIERPVGPKCFWPRPNVESAVIRMVFKPAAERTALPWTRIRAVTNAVFGSRRKILKNALKGLFRGAEEDADRGAMLSSLGIDPESRGERLAPEEFLAIANMLPEPEKEKRARGLS